MEERKKPVIIVQCVKSHDKGRHRRFEKLRGGSESDVMGQGTEKPSRGDVE